MSEERILIVGTGALACLFAARFAAVDIPVAMLGSWQAALQTLAERGVTLITPDGERKTYPVLATSDPAQVQGVRQALVLVKAWQTERAARQLQGCLAGEGVALTLQNGWGNCEVLSQYLGAERVALGVTTLGATLLTPGEVRQAGEGVVSLGLHPRLAFLTTYLRKAGFELEFTSNVEALVWGKLVVNAAINPLSALLRVPNGELIRRASARELMHRAAREAAAVAQVQGVALPYADPVERVETIAQRTAENFSSMLQDILRGAPTEIDAICGKIVHIARQIGLPTPTLETLWLLVRALAERPHEQKPSNS
ncbi:MAG: 2-dehydropantoate 2-reductase [Anaerolineales bacterium]|nr:2-dehydropantoate 2-reductase [Anaerolineales bacterium]MCS7247712.1 2-dehydropantoate 2-reductase [Anaerolineales bacterium]MDW8161522.1 2-dehydropantoate 2-reductase [Anaerolineales bacterium]MDW8446858.1 2-dehydropantoate 2-reductase [Anaerolineales bacterium]